MLLQHTSILISYIDDRWIFLTISEICTDQNTHLFHNCIESFYLSKIEVEFYFKKTVTVFQWEQNLTDGPASRKRKWLPHPKSGFDLPNLEREDKGRQ